MKLMKNLYNKIYNSIYARYLVLFILLLMAIVSLSLKIIMVVESNPFFYTKF
jgi:hypothetical protein